MNGVALYLLLALMPSLAIAALAVADSGGATEPSGFVSNVLLARSNLLPVTLKSDCDDRL